MSLSSSAAPIDVEEYVVKELGLKLGKPAGWNEWSRPELQSQGSVVCFTPEAPTVERPSVSLNMMLQHGGANVDLNTYTTMSSYQLHTILDVSIESGPSDLMMGRIPGK